MSQPAMTTPFGRRTVTLGHVAGQARARAVETGKTTHKWKVFQAVTEARERLGLPDRALAVLSALLSFHPETALTAGDPLVVFPSNESLAARAHGIAPATLRRHLAVLVEAGLVIRRDSPNGKRYCRRDSDGALTLAFGFDLAPLVARAEEFEALAAAVQAEKRALRLARERVTLARRDMAKLIALGQAEGLPGDWNAFEASALALSMPLRRTAGLAETEALAARCEALVAGILSHLEFCTNFKNPSATDTHSERHKQNSKPDFSESEPAFQKDRSDRPGDDSAMPGAMPVSQHPEAVPGTTGGPGGTQPSRPAAAKPGSGTPLAMVLEACPDIRDYMTSGFDATTPPPPATWPDLLKAAELVRAMLGISPDAWRDAVETMGPVDAAIVVAAILQKGDEVRFPGGYLRALTEKKRDGQFSVGPILMALLGGRLKSLRKQEGPGR